MRPTQGRDKEGFYVALASGQDLPAHLRYPGEEGKGGRRRQRGGGGNESRAQERDVGQLESACDNRWVKLAVDSAIVLAGAAAVTATGYAGLSVLQYYMTTFGLSASIMDVIIALYSVFKTLFTSTIPGLASVAAGLAGAAVDVGAAVGSVAIRTIAPIAPFLPFLLIMYGRQATTDAFDTVKDLYRDARGRVDRIITRSMSKKAELERSIATKSEQIRRAVRNVKEATLQTRFTVTDQVTRLSNGVCALIDKVISGTSHVADYGKEIARMFDTSPVSYGLDPDIGLDPDLGGLGGGKYRKRTMHRSKKRRASRKRMSRRYRI